MAAMTTMSFLPIIHLSFGRRFGVLQLKACLALGGSAGAASCVGCLACWNVTMARAASMLRVRVVLVGAQGVPAVARASRSLSMLQLPESSGRALAND